MEFKVDYKINNKMSSADISNISLDGEIGSRFDRFAYERVYGEFAITEFLGESEKCLTEQYDDEFSAGMWRGEFWGKFIISAVRVCKMKSNEKLKVDIKNSVYRVLKHQDSDGYLSSYRDSKNIFKNDPEKAMNDLGWKCDYNWNLWGQKYTLWALLEAAMLFDDNNILDAATRMGENIIRVTDELNATIKDTGVMHGMASGSILKPMLILYRLTGNEVFYNFAKKIVKEWQSDECPGLVNNPLKNGSPAGWYKDSEEWIPKAYEMMSCYDGLCEFYRINGDKLYLDAVKNFWDSVKEKESNILGSVGYCERFSNAKDYPDAATEICDVIHWIRLSYELFSIDGDVKYIEAIEKAFLNAFLAGIYKDGKSGAFFVRSAGRHVTAEMQVETKYQNCCLNNAPRGFVNTAEAIVTKSGDDYYINSYIQSTVKFEDISFRIGDKYLTGGAPHIIIRGAKKGTVLYFRIPEWSKEATVITAEGKTTVSDMKYYRFVMPSDEAFVRLCFDMSLEITDFSGEYKNLPYTDYHIQRWCDTRNGPCNRNQMVRHPMSVIRRGPLMLSRSKRFGNSSEDMFSGETVYAKFATAVCEVVKSYHTLCTCNVTIKTEDKEYNYIMCDYASSANEDLSDFNYFTIFV